MKFNFTANNLKGKERVLQRAFEILPGATSWGIILGMSALALCEPLIAAIIIIAFYFYWLLKLVYLTAFLVFSYIRFLLEKDTNWMERAKGLDNIDEYLENLEGKTPQGTFRDRYATLLHKKEVEKIQSLGIERPLTKDIYHLVIIPVAKEPKEVIEPGIISLSEGTFPPERIVVVLALEERAKETIKKDTEEVRKKYKNRFFDLIVIVHPDGIVGEAKGKGANATFAAREMAEYFKKKNIPYENVISSCFDSDTVVTPEYFASLTYYFLATPHRLRASFQPIPVYNNNIWDAPGLTRVLEAGSSFFQLIESTNPQTLVTFSSHSMSFKALVEVGYWPIDMISDDSAIYWKALVHYDGDYRVVPMYTTVSMDAVVADTWWQTIRNVYKQRRRWAWGVENLPIVMRAFLKKSGMPFFQRIKVGYKLFESHISWTTWAFLLSIVGWLPAIFATKDYSHTVFYYSAPRITGTIFHLATISLLISIILSLMLLPKRTSREPMWRRVGYAFQWLLMPLTIIFLSAFPALDAQTRLMFGRYMTFWVTDKSRKTK